MVKRKRIWSLLVLAMLLCALSTTAFAIDEAEVQSAIAASSQEEVAGNIFIWFLCAVAFLKISQKIDSFMSALGINVGRTGGSMLGELLIAGRAVSAGIRATGGAIGGIFNRNHASSTSTTQAAGQEFTGSGGGLVGVARRAAGNAAASSATGRGSGLSGFIGGAMFGSSMKNGGQLASDVVSAVAKGNYASVGSITGEQASQALTSYLGYQTAVQSSETATSASPTIATEPGSTTVIQGGQASLGGGQADTSQDAIPASGDDIITADGGAAASTVIGMAAGEAGSSADEGHHTNGQSIPMQPPTFRNVEIGGGRITGYETPAGGGDERQFAMYNAAQYMEPTGTYETVQTTDGETWYKQYAEPVVQKTPYEDDAGKIQYDQKIVEQMPQIPKRKDKV